MTQSDVQTKLDTFITNETGKKADYPAGQFSGQCLSLVKRWVDVLADKICAPISGTGFADGYYSNFPAPLPQFFMKQVFGSGTSYPTGSIIFYPTTHHAAIIVQSTVGSPTTKVFEQNADPDGSSAHIFDRPNIQGSRVAAGVLVPIVQVPVPQANMTIRMNPGSHWNVRTSPQMANNIRSDGYAIGGQLYAAQIVNGWAEINFMGKTGYVGPATFTRV